MIPQEIIGALIVALPALVIALVLFWRRMQPVFWFVVALIVVGVGYLTTTGATTDIATYVLGKL